MEILARKRTLTGKKVKRLRTEGFIPAVVYSKASSNKEKDVLPIEINLKEFLSVYKVCGTSSIVGIKLEDSKSTIKTLVTAIQKEPISLDVLHVSFFEVDLAEKVTRMVPIELINEDKCEPVNSGEGILITILDEIEIECLPTDIPSAFTVDVSVLKAVDDVLTIAEGIKYDSSKIEIKTDKEEAIVKVDYAAQLEQAEDSAASIEDVEITTAKKETPEDEDSSKSKKDS